MCNIHPYKNSNTSKRSPLLLLCGTVLECFYDTVKNHFCICIDKTRQDKPIKGASLSQPKPAVNKVYQKQLYLTGKLVLSLNPFNRARYTMTKH